MAEITPEKNTHNATDESGQPEPEESFLLEGPKLAELGEEEVVVNLLPRGEGGLTAFLHRRHICTEPRSVFLHTEDFFRKKLRFVNIGSFYISIGCKIIFPV